MRRAAASFLQFAGLTLIISVLIAFITMFAAVAVVVQGSSMEPALHNGERVLVNKLVYRLRPPRRGEIVLFRHGHMPGRMLIKRVIGLPQEELSISRGLVRVDGRPLVEDYILSPQRKTMVRRMFPAGTYSCWATTGTIAKTAPMPISAQCRSAAF